jgi:hypothetical protein
MIEIVNGKRVISREFIDNVSNCDECCFQKNIPHCHAAPCTRSTRTDGRDVYFVAAEAVPEVDVTPWKEVAAQNQRNSDYYRGLLDQIGDLLGIDAYTSDDGSIQSEPLRAKLPELVAKKVFEATAYRAKVAMLEFDIQQLENK